MVTFADSIPHCAPPADPAAALLCAPYCSWSPAAILAHFQTRTTPHYFAQRDDEQAGREQIVQLLADCFIYNGEAYNLPAGFDWTVNPSQDREWLILLHKFYFAPGLGAEFVAEDDARYLHKWLQLTDAWIETVPLAFLPSDVMGRRVQNWIFAHHYFVTTARTTAIPPAFYLKFLRSLHQQVSYLCENLTPARNHRTIELSAIFLAAVAFPEFADAACWLAFAQRELVANLQADLRPDGVHCEQSTDYHHLVVKNYLGVKRLAAANGIAFPACFDERLQKALDFALFVHRPDGAIPALSDGDSRSFLDLLHQGHALYGNPAYLYVATQGAAGAPPSDRARCFPAGGYTILRSGWGAGATAFTDERYLIFDCGPLGEGNHGHLDLLSFEAAAFGQPLVVDPGRYTYHEPHPATGAMNWRAHFRGTAAHNTVQVDGKEQTRYQFHKKKFKIRGPEPIWQLCAFLQKDNVDLVHGLAASTEYDAIHERMICFAHREYWIITDLLRAPTVHRYDLHFHLAASAYGQTTLRTQDNTVVLQAPHLLLAQPAHEQTTVVLHDGYVSRSYGVKEVAPVVQVTRSAATTIFHTVLYPYAAAAPQVQVEMHGRWPQDRYAATATDNACRVIITHADRVQVDTFHLAQQSVGAPYSYAYTRCEFPLSTAPAGQALLTGNAEASPTPP
ncbi:MAG: alginate lyase family protein [Caldilineaceae bacterium]